LHDTWQWPGSSGSGLIMSAAHPQLGLERLEQIKYAVLDRTGGIAVIPWRKEP
jgi:hypothetical protein